MNKVITGIIVAAVMAFSVSANARYEFRENKIGRVLQKAVTAFVDFELLPQAYIVKVWEENGVSEALGMLGLTHKCQWNGYDGHYICRNPNNEREVYEASASNWTFSGLTSLFIRAVPTVAFAGMQALVIKRVLRL